MSRLLPNVNRLAIAGPVTCKGGGGHRRAQAGGSTYICAQGGWLSTSPISCGGGAPAVPLGPSRFVVGPDRVPQAQAQQYCRANYQTLASIHSGAEQAQAAAACAATHHAANDASDNNFGCCKPPRYRCSGLHSSQDASDIVVGRDRV